jgi:hypothetical protein
MTLLFVSSLGDLALYRRNLCLAYGDTAPREVGRLLKRRFAVRSGLVGWLHLKTPRTK